MTPAAGGSCWVTWYSRGFRSCCCCVLVGGGGGHNKRERRRETVRPIIIETASQLHRFFWYRSFASTTLLLFRELDLQYMSMIDGTRDESALSGWRDDEGDLVEASTEFLAGDQRSLQQTETGRTVLTILYLCVLGICFVIPIFYYFRLQCEERYARRLRDLELAGMAHAMQQSENLYSEESRAARRKYREERKARIMQLLSPVRMIVETEHFPHLRKATTDDSPSPPPQDMEAPKEEAPSSTSQAGDVEASSDLPETSEVKNLDVEESLQTPDEPRSSDNDSTDKQNDEEAQVKVKLPSSLSNQSLSRMGQSSKSLLDSSVKSVDEDQYLVEVPTPGFNLTNAQTAAHKTRLVPNVCSICLGNYQVGTPLVWSNNEACEHVFHEQCILQWLLKQREGPLCPCCRRDFVLDPYDLEDEETDNMFARTNTGDTSDDDADYAMDDFTDDRTPYLRSSLDDLVNQLESGTRSQSEGSSLEW
eukprot:Nitzschia sp. Nitz4//scaffold67_size101165//89606//91117//NITZ4_004543-RA/size101165-augustus-gene-0.17-mRNA-1//1//CDS//3329556516//1032//frame0